MSMEGHDRQLLVSDCGCMAECSKSMVLQQQSYEDRSRQSRLVERRGSDERLSTDRDGLGSPRPADIWLSDILVRDCANS